VPPIGAASDWCSVIVMAVQNWGSARHVGAGFAPADPGRWSSGTPPRPA